MKRWQAWMIGVIAISFVRNRLFGRRRRDDHA